MSVSTDDVPTLDQLADLPPTLDVRPTARILGVSAAHLYESIKRGDAPVRTIKVGNRIKVLTSSLVALLEGRPDVRSGETTKDHRRSEAMFGSRTSYAVK